MHAVHWQYASSPSPVGQADLAAGVSSGTPDDVDCSQKVRNIPAYDAVQPLDGH